MSFNKRGYQHPIYLLSKNESKKHAAEERNEMALDDVSYLKFICIFMILQIHSIIVLQKGKTSSLKGTCHFVFTDESVCCYVASFLVEYRKKMIFTAINC
jgi:hypothetical protein